MHEDFFDRHLIRAIFLNQGAHVRKNLTQALRQCLTLGHDPTAGEILETVALRIDDAVSGCPRPRVHP